MVFKLIRIDAQSPSKIQLSTGVHVIGRGKFLHNDDTDKRVSRNHAELEVTNDIVNLKALHQNPCFFIKNNTDETELLQQDCTISLCHGDRFGLIPDHFWYEVLHCHQDNEDIPKDGEGGTNGLHTEGVKDVADQNSKNSSDSATDSKETIHFENYEEDAVQNRSCSPSIMNDQESTDEYESKPQVPLDADKRTPVKRSNSSPETSPIDVKKVKTEPDDGVVSGAAVAGPSNGQSSSDSDGKTKDDDTSPANPNNVPSRERCMYGANCYSRRVNRVSWRQLEMLWEFLNSNRSIATAYNRSMQAKQYARRKWTEIAEILNSQGDGAHKDWAGWTKYWVDYKAKLKKRVAMLRASHVQTGGGPSTEKSLTEIEKKFIQILGKDIGQGLPGVQVELPPEIGAAIDVDVQDSPSSEYILRMHSVVIPIEPIPTPTQLHSVEPLTQSLPLEDPDPPAPSVSRTSTPRPTTSAARSPRRRRRRREPPMSQEAARRALVLSTKRHADAAVRMAEALENIVQITTTIGNTVMRMERILNAAFPRAAEQRHYE